MCSGYVPVVDIVTEPNAIVDDVIVSPPPTKRTKSNYAGGILPSSRDNDHNDAPFCNDQKMPANPEGDNSKMPAIPNHANNQARE